MHCVESVPQVQRRPQVIRAKVLMHRREMRHAPRTKSREFVQQSVVQLSIHLEPGHEPIAAQVGAISDKTGARRSWRAARPITTSANRRRRIDR
jgi:hypothetical protein